jgi:hypothetical protein
MIAPIATKPPAMEIKGGKLWVVAGEVGMSAEVPLLMVVVVGGRTV